MNEDNVLLRHFVEKHSEEAFTTLVQQHLPMVHATALRRVGGDAHLAQDVAQTVFISLARKASSLKEHSSLAGWLYISTHRATAEVVRREQRRKQREVFAHAMNITNTPDDPPLDPASLRLFLDDALVELKSEDREAVILRFFAQRSFAQIGAALRITEEAARKRVDRAIEKLHSTLCRRGITSTVAALGSALSAAGITTAPATLTGQVAAIALAESVIFPTVAATSTLAVALLPAVAIATMLTGLWTIVPQQRANATMAAEIAHLENTPKVATRVKSEINAPSRAPVAARTLPPPTFPPSTSANVIPAPLATRSFSTSTREVLVTPEGTLQWEGEPVTLDEFVILLAAYQSEAAHRGSQLIVKGNGTRFPQLSYALDEARKAGIRSLVVESDSEPDPTMPNTWF